MCRGRRHKTQLGRGGVRDVFLEEGAFEFLNKGWWHLAIRKRGVWKGIPGRRHSRWGMETRMAWRDSLNKMIILIKGDENV